MNLNRGVAIAAALISVAGAVTAVGRYDVEAARALVLPDGSRVDLEGVCKFDETDVTCWNADGVLDANVTDKVQSYYLGSSSGTELHLGFKKKNRLVVFSRDGASVMNPRMLFYSQAGEFLPATQISSDFGRASWNWALLKVPREANTAGVIVSPLEIAGPPPVSLPLSGQANLSYDGISVEIRPEMQNHRDSESAVVPARASPGPVRSLLTQGKHWDYRLNMNASGAGTIQITCTLLDKQHRPIKYVDQNGRPVPEIQVVRDEPQATGQTLSSSFVAAASKSKYFKAVEEPNTFSESDRSFACNVNPAEVGFVQISGTRTLRILFKGIPLDPK